MSAIGIEKAGLCRQFMGSVLAGGLVVLLLAHPSFYSRDQAYFRWSLVVVLAWLIVLMKEWSGGKALLPPREILGAAALLGGSAVLASAFSPNAAWMALLPLGSQVLFLWIGWWLGSDRELSRFLGIVVLAGGGVVGGYGVLQHLHLDPLPPGTAYSDRVVSVFENPNYLGNFLASILPLGLAAFFWSQTSKVRLGGFVLVGLLYAGLLIAASRGAWWAALTGVVVVSGGYLIEASRGFTQIRWGWISTLLLLIGALTFLLSRETVLQGPAGPVSVQERMISSKNIAGPGVQHDPSVNHRYHIWQVTWEMIQECPFLGNGYGAYAQRFAEVRQAMQVQGLFPVAVWNPHLDPQYAHNEYLQIWAESGLLGLVGYCGLVIAVVAGAMRRGWQPGSAGLGLWGELGLIAVMLMDSLVNYPLHLPLNSTLFWLTLGILANRGGCKTPAP